MTKSAGVLVYRYRNNVPEVLLGHMGGPFWAKKNQGAWSIPKGEYGDDEDAFEAAKRELHEETGFCPKGDYRELAVEKQPKGKHIRIWAAEADFDPSKLKSNTFEMEWPPRSGKTAEFPEIDRAEWFSARIARKKLVKSQVAFVDALCELLDRGDTAGESRGDRDSR
jgi:predicted NUDIX family NTP pyrophosphohydrolase